MKNVCTLCKYFVGTFLVDVIQATWWSEQGHGQTI